MDESAGDIHQHAPQDAASEISEHARETLDSLSNFRIHPHEINVTSDKPHGMGGKAEVVQVTLQRGDGKDEQQVAVKKLRTHDDMNKRKFCNEFVNEVDVMAGLSHENIVRFIGFVEDLKNEEAWIILSWEPNGNVREFLASGDWEIPERLSLIKDVFAGVKYLHARQPPICHGDLKSLNILVNSSYRAIITDFGSARVITDSEPAGGTRDEAKPEPNPTSEEVQPQIRIATSGYQLTLTGPAFSLRWAPPEVVNGERPSLPADIWAAGWLCWEVITDKVPFPDLNSAGAITLLVVQGHVPSTREDTQLSQIIRLCSLMTDCWSFEPLKRPSINRCFNEIKWMPSITPLGGIPSDSKEKSIELLLEMGRIQYYLGNHENAASQSQRALGIATDENNEKASARALYQLGEAYRARFKYSEAEECFIRAQDIYSRISDDHGHAVVLGVLGCIYSAQSKYTKAEEFHKRAQAICSYVGHEYGQAITLRRLGHIYTAQSKYSEAKGSYVRAQEIFARVGDDHGQANTLRGLGGLYRAQSKYPEAEEAFIGAQDIYARLGDDSAQAITLKKLGSVYSRQSKYPEAEECYTRAHDICTRIGYHEGRAITLHELGHARRNQGRSVEAAAAYAEARDLYAQIGDSSSADNVSQWLASVQQE